VGSTGDLLDPGVTFFAEQFLSDECGYCDLGRRFSRLFILSNNNEFTKNKNKRFLIKLSPIDHERAAKSATPATPNGLTLKFLVELTL
jgi:hypothetical protein